MITGSVQCGGAGQAGDASPEKMLNRFVRSVALAERAGNALGTLAFTWATVVLLGGYPTVLRPTNDFWLATTIVFLEAVRMFSRNNRLDYQVFFHTRGAVRPINWKGLLVIILCLSNVLNLYFMVISKKHGRALSFIKELTTMIHDDRYRCVAASLLRSMCLHARHQFRDSDLEALSYTVREVLERAMDAEGAELEILIGLSSQICRVIPAGFARELEQGNIKDRFVKRLIDALNANTEASADSPGIRRVILEQAISMMEHDSSGYYYASCFKLRRMAEAVSRLEETASGAENYAIFLGDAGLMEEHSETLLSLVVRVKHLLF